ncbi:MAG: polysaccharide pyruvyl transferase family protein [Clostridia bacterium]|nr:polysaccharide pyruvyl transferase family protein [Clostridia bacterium]
MKKIGIVTIIDNDNYGNRLQNYAVQEILKKYGYNTITLLNQNCTNNRFLFIFRILRKSFFEKNKKHINQNRKKNFDNFNKNIIFSKKKILPFFMPKGYEYFITGSDQVWNPYMGRMRDIDLLAFAPKEKRISISASFGVDFINKKYQKKLKRELKKFKSISVREKEGKKIINTVLKNKKVDVLIDPTMMLTKDDWNLVIKKPRKMNTNKYIINYFLGNISENKMNYIQQIATENNCEIINILDPKSQYYECGPSEFLYLEKNAFLICTDSFHASVFAIIFDRPFIIFERESKNNKMNSRIKTLLSKFQLKDREYNDKVSKDNYLKHNYSFSYKILEDERKKVKKFLNKALNT